MKSSRQKEILSLLAKEKIVNTQKLAERFSVSLETIRRDLDILEKQGCLRKVYGGAEALVDEGKTWPSFSLRRERNKEAKAAICAEAVRYIQDDCVIALDAGTTIGELCRFLTKRKGLTVIVSDIHTANLLLQAGMEKVYLMGGFLTKDGTSNGLFQGEFFSSISGIDVFVCSGDGVDTAYGLTSNGLGINELKRRYLEKSKKRILLADASKFTQRCTYKVCDLTDFDFIITDASISGDTEQAVSALGVELIVANKE